MGLSLLWWIVNEIDSLLDAAPEAGLTGLKKLLLILVDVAKDVESLLGTTRLIVLSERILGDRS